MECTVPNLGDVSASGFTGHRQGSWGTLSGMPDSRAAGQLAAWCRAATVAGTTFAVTAAAGLALAWLLATDDMSLDQLLTTAGALVAGAFGAGVDGRMGGSLLVISGTARGSAHAVPLTLTLLAGATAVLSFRRTTTPGAGLRAGLADAARSAGLLAGLVLGVALLSRTDSGGILVALDWVATRDADQVRGDVGVVAWQAPVGAFLLVLALLAVTVLARGDGPARLAAPLRGVVTLLLLLPVVGLLGLVMLAGGDATPTGDLEAASGVGLVLAGLVSWGYAVLVLGAFGPAGRTVDGTASGDLDVRFGSFHERLGHWTTLEPGLWAAVPLTLVVLTLAARRVVRASDDAGHVRGDLLRWLGLLAVVLPVLGLAARLSGSGSAVGQVWGDRGRGELSATLGVAIVPGTLSLLVVAALVATVVGWLATRPSASLPSPSAERTLEEPPVTPVTEPSSDGHAPSAHP